MKFHERLKLLRSEIGFSQKEFAEKYGIEVSKYNKWENGKYSPSNNDPCNLAKILIAQLIICLECLRPICVP